ncbi:5420_t:CDS:10 [Diversispora eburnea]|uniref:5420_t:CDS:1 n=1 Tax=Diversispora eburnea TaxID=1213867 RepID=A0A9N8ZBV0_9GLOM|nr:5420_t:CDS:10 [Diversispora eburnea]
MDDTDIQSNETIVKDPSATNVSSENLTPDHESSHPSLDDNSSGGSEQESHNFDKEYNLGDIRLEDSEGQNVGQQNTGEGTSSQAARFIKKGLNKFLPSWREKDDTSGFVKIIFHAHFPRDIDERGHPVIMGSIKELGNWTEPIVRLQQPYRHYAMDKGTHWISDSVSVPIACFEEEVKYRYGIFRKVDKKKDDYEFYYEKKDYRILNIRGGNQFDLVYEIEIRGSPELRQIHEHTFLNFLFESLTSDNAKEIIMEFQGIANRYNFYVRDGLTLPFIHECGDEAKRSKEKEKRIFLCVLLGYYISLRVPTAFGNGYSLPKFFQSGLFLDCLDKYNPDRIPNDDAKDKLLIAISSLVRDNAVKGSFDWFKIFSIASTLDPEYSFIDSLNDIKYPEEKMQKFIKQFQKEVVFYINKIEDPIIYARIINWLFQMCYNMEPILKFWTEIIDHTTERDQIIRKPFIRRVQEIISNDDAVSLLRYFEKVPVDLREEVCEAFRKRLLRLLNFPHIDWSKDNVTAVKVIMQDPQFQWSEDEFVEALELISQSLRLNLLMAFPHLLKYWFETFVENPSEKLPDICSFWYQQLLDQLNDNTSSSEDDWKFVYEIFNHLSLIYPIIEKNENIYDKLVEVSINRAKQFHENKILKATPYILELKQPNIIKHFISIVKEILKNSVTQADDELLRKVKYICGSNSKVLEVSRRLQDLHPIKNNDISLIVLSLLKSANFWIYILNAVGVVESLNEHSYIIHIRKIMHEFYLIIDNGSITFEHLRDLLKKENSILIEFFRSATSDFDYELNSELLTQVDLERLRKQRDNHELKLDQLRTFYTQFCPDTKVKDIQLYLDDINSRTKELKIITLKKTLKDDHWGIHRKIEGAAKRAYKLSKSKTFKNIFDSQIQAEEAELTVESVAENLMVTTFDKYDELCKKYNEWEKLKCSEGSFLWKNVTDVKMELNLMESYVQLERNPKLINTLIYLSQVPKQIERLQQLSEVALIFKVKHTKNDWLGNLLLILKNDVLWLGKLVNFFEKYNKHLSNVNDDCWELIKELSRASDFIIFLRSVAEHDIKNLINGVDDSDERLIQEDTVSSLIQVKQFLLPLLNSSKQLSLKSFLHELLGIIDLNPSLGSKIALCNNSNMALQNMYNNISNRGEVTKEKIVNAVKEGTYTFKRVDKSDKSSLILTYPVNPKQYSLSDLHDLRGRALLISKPGAAIDLAMATTVGESSTVKDGSKNIMDEFVTQVDLAQEILNIASQLIQMGHFDYRNFEKAVKGTTEMKNLEQKLKEDLLGWEEIVNKAQEQHYYLTFFPARHILAFFDYFTSDVNTKDPKDQENDIECEILIKFVNSKAKLQTRKLGFGIQRQNKTYFEILCQIGTKLQRIFEKVPKQIHYIKSRQGRIASDVVFRGKLFVAACNDKNLVPNIIMSLYANHGSYPQAWQLLICTASTTTEELAIFIKRCFFAVNNGYDNHLFCIANLELLDFELQYKLVNNIRKMREIQPNYYLALICCRVDGMHHHILDQFSQDVHATSGLGFETMKVMYKELCPNLLVVTSDLSGQGKTELIKQVSFEKRKILRSFLISDEVDFGTLVHRFKEFNIRSIESLHLNIVSADFCIDVNMFLFELLTLGMVSNNMDIACLPDTYVFIEIASTVNQTLLRSLPMVENLSSIHLTWDIKNLTVSQEINSPIQVVCQYLDAYDNLTLDEFDINLLPTASDLFPHIPLLPSRCQHLIKKYLFDKNQATEIQSFRFVEIFINVLADQLVRLSSSSYFKVDNLKLMIKENTIRNTLLETLLLVSTDFATRSVKTKAAQLESTIKGNIGNMIQQDDLMEEIEDGNERLGNIVQWDDSNHLLVFFLSQTPDSICALYRDKTKVPTNVRTLLKSQHVGDKNWKLDDYNKMSSKVLLEKLECIARKTMHEIEYPRYALSADNLLKMALILLRARANIPVVVCGEAGFMEVEFDSLDLHAGITENVILNFMTEAQKKAETKELWLFFDEVNTCNHIGLFADLIAHRSLLGKAIHSNIRLFAACNPYRIRTRAQTEAGIKALKKVNKNYEEHSNLVYQVKPLPDQILDYVWDYGVLNPTEEQKYIKIMVESSLKDLGSDLLSELLFESQKFIRAVEEPYSVSLRDVRRAVTLVKFFWNSFQDRPPIRKGGTTKHSRYPSSELVILRVRCYILAIGLCYHSRLYEQELRKKYRIEMGRILTHHGSFVKEGDFNNIIRQEQEDYVNRMDPPPNTALNEALLENVLVMIVCILTKIPVFIVGAPGSSKSLAIRLVSQNLRGSSSSTSDGILKVFQKAINYQETSSKEFEVISVVLLDEVGLAETSPYNPLKVLHSLLEPSYPSDGPSVSVVGISNWRLDNSKSSRALLVQRPKFDLNDLVDTAERLLQSKTNTTITKASLQPLAQAYSEYEHSQTLSNFHGLRDYYALVKSLSLGKMTPENIQKALVRNFGGTDQTEKLCEEFFGEVLKNFNNSHSWTYKPIPVERLINANLDDQGARHLMVIGKSDSIVNLLTYQLRKRNLDPVVIFEDPKYYTRVALGAYANPMLYVAKSFRCILVMDENKLRKADPPLLNRFEKQKMTINDALTVHQKKMVSQLLDWANQMSEKSNLSYDEKIYWKNVYFKVQHHDNLVDYFESLLGDPEIIKNNPNGVQVIINSFSNINTDVKTCLQDIISCQVDKLSTFKTESQLQNRVKHFWLESENQMLILQCDVNTVNSGCIKLAKFIIEQFRNEFLMKKNDNHQPKHACIILHIHREQENTLASFNFMCGWEQVTIETLIQQEKPLSILLEGSLCDVINTAYPFEEILEQELLWCLLYNWQFNVASNKKLLYPYSSFSMALQAYIRAFVRKPIAKILCALERLSRNLLSFWYKMFNDNKIINIEDIQEPSPDNYLMPPGIYNLQFPFSYYFMNQIDNFKTLYIEEISLLKDDPTNMDPSVDDLYSYLINAHIKEFSNKILSMIPILKSSPIDSAPELYFKDFVSVIAYNEPGNKNPEILEFIFIKRLAFEQFLVEQASQFMLEMISDNSKGTEIQSLEIDQWQHEDDLPSDFVKTVLDMLIKLTPNERNLTARRSFILKCLNIIPIRSPVRLELYKELFSNLPFPLMKAIILTVFKTEESINKNTFFKLITQPIETLKESTRLNIINSCFNINQLHQPMAALCCDIIQLEFFSNLESSLFNDDDGTITAAFYYNQAINALSDGLDIQPLQRISAIAFLKEFIRILLSSLVNIDVDDGTKEFRKPSQELLESQLYRDINGSMNYTFPLIHSLKIYFLRDLRRREFTVDEIKRFFEEQSDLLPWFTNLKWDESEQSKLPFNPFWSINKYDEVEKAYFNYYNLDNKGPLNQIIQSLRENDNENNIINTRISLFGMIIMHLYSVQASREWIEPYKQNVSRILINNYFLYEIKNPKITNGELIMKSVIAHIISVHSSLPEDFSPLTIYLHRLQDCKNHFILACQSDMESVLFNAISAAVAQSKCPECGKTIGGTNYHIAQGNTRLDAQPIATIAAKDQPGFITEPPNNDIKYGVRNMPPKYFAEHIRNDWNVLKKILNISDENLAILIYSILDILIKNKQSSTQSTTKSTQFTRDYVSPLIKNVNETITNFKNKLDQSLKDAKITGNILEGEINQTLAMDTKYCNEYLPRLWRTIGKINFASFRAFYFGDHALNTAKYPLIEVFDKHFEKLHRIKYLYPIVRFVQILSSRLGYQLTRKEADEKTFRSFIEEESNNGKLQETHESLTLAFNEFEKAWNMNIDQVTRFQCHDLPEDKPQMNIDCKIVLGLLEGRDEGIYLCAILIYLINLQNNFLQDVMNISAGKFLRPHNFINYEWDESILHYSQHNLGVGRGQDIIYDLSKIESILAKQLVTDKIHIEGGGPELPLYMDTFPYHLELLQGSMRFLGEIKGLIPQESIPIDKITTITELFSFLEILLCFVKRTSVGDGEILIKDFVNKWMKLSNLIENNEYKNLLNLDLKLKHLIALYELIEDQVANVTIKYIPEKYRENLDDKLEDEISRVVDFDQKTTTQEPRIPAEAFAIALKRFMQRFLSVDSIKETNPIYVYLEDTGLNLWPDNINNIEELVGELLPYDLLVQHTFHAYQFTMDKIQMTMNQQITVNRHGSLGPSTLINRNNVSGGTIKRNNASRSIKRYNTLNKGKGPVRSFDNT